MVRVQSAAGVSPSISVQSGKSALRRDLRQQASRFALMSAIGLAAAAGGSLVAPGEALADCVVSPATVVCNTTATTNTAHPNGQPNDRAYEVLEALPLAASVSSGSAVTGHGLALSNLGDGGVAVTNGGTITVDAGNAPTEGGTAALAITANGGALTYTGGAITNNGTGAGLGARQNGGAAGIDINLTGAVRGTYGINASNNGSGGVSITAAAPVVGTVLDGIYAETRGGGGISIVAGDAVGQVGSGVTAQLLNAPASTNAITIAADNLTGRTGVFASNGGLGAVSIATTGDITGTTGEGLFAAGGGDVDVAIGGVVTGGTQGLKVQAAGDISVQAAEIIALNGHGVDIDNQGAGEVNFVATGPITATNGHGVFVRDTAIGGNISIVTGAVTANTAPYDGINVNSVSATADISVVVNGDIQAGDYGIEVSTELGSLGDIDVTANGSITGGGGIYADALGAGSVNVTAVGPITATSEYGIIAVALGAGDVTVNAGDVTSAGSTGIEVGAVAGGDIDVTAGRVSGTYGVYAVSQGGGATVRTNGAVTGTTDEGIRVSAGGAVRVEVADTVTGATDGADIVAGDGGSGDVSVTGAGGFVGLDGYGLLVDNIGSGRVDIDISGAVVAGNGVGVYVESDAIDSGDINVTTGDVTALAAGYEGIVADSSSLDADVSITANGNVVAAGVGVAARLFADATGDIHVTTNGSVTAETGIGAQNLGSGAITVNAVGPITATSTGIVARSQGGDISIAAGDVSATADFGVIALQESAAGGGDIDITTTGAVSGVTAILAQSAGSGGVSVNASGPLTATENGLVAISAGGDVTVTAGDVSAIDAYGVFAWQENPAGAGNVHVTTTGAISGRTGIQARNDGSGASTVVASGPIAAVDVGIMARSRGGDITIAAGDVSSTGEYGIFSWQENAVGAGDIDIATTGAVSGFVGIHARNDGSGAVSVTTSGPVAANAASIEARSRGGDITIAAGDVTATAGYGIFAQQNNTSGAGNIDITATGAVSGAIGIQALNDGSGAISVNASGPVTAIDVGISTRSQGGDITIDAGDVSADGGDGVFALQENTAGAGDIDITTTGAVSGDIGILALNEGSGAVSVNAGGPITALATGIEARSRGGDITIAAGDVTATVEYAIFALQGNAAGDGDIDITTTGAVSGDIAILAQNDGFGAVSVNAGGPITATSVGIIGRTRGGDIAIAAGAVTSGGDVAVFAEQTNAAGAGGIDITTTGAISSALNGIQASNFGSGAIRIAAGGTVNGAGGAGIVAQGDAIEVTISGLVSGSDYGLFLDGGHGGAGDISVTGAGGFSALEDDAVSIFNAGSGTVTYDVSGPVTATSGSGVVVRDTVDGGDISVTTGAVNALNPLNGEDGINVASDSMSADVTIVANGALAATANGVLAFIRDAAATGDIDVRTNGSVTGTVGVNAQNAGVGGTTVTAVGPVTATFAGLVATSNGGDVTVTAGDVASAGIVGISAQIQSAGDGGVAVTAANVTGATGVLTFNAGTGDTRITTTGTVAGSAAGAYGIHAFNDTDAGDIIIDANNVSGADAGIRVDNHGVGSTDLTVRGLVHGGPVGVSVFSDGDQDVRIANGGVIRSTSGLSSDRAIEASGGFIDFTNTGTLVGDINFQSDASVFDNEGSWNTAGGDSIFAGVDDELINAATGSILAGSIAGVQEVTIFRELETFRNDGSLILGDNGAGDVVLTSADTVFATGSLLQVDISGLALSDLFATTGTLTLEAGARLDVNFVQPLTLGGRYVVARADGGLTGTFDFEDRLLTAFVGLRDGYTATTAYIELAQLRALIEAGVTPNQRQAGEGADSLPDTNPLKTALLLLPDDGTAQDAFDQLSGEIHPAARRAMADDSRQLRGAVLDRLTDERADGSVWGRALIEERITDADENAAKVEHDARGLIFGADRALTDNLTVGVAGGWFNTDLAILQRNSSGSTQSQQALAYLGARMDRWGLRAGVGYARTSTDTRREIAFPGFSAPPTADYDGSVLQGFVEAAYRLPLHGGYVEPFANLTAITADTDAFHEIDGPAALAVEARSESLTATTLGFRFQMDRTGALSLRGTAGWRSLSGDLEPTGRHAFGGGATFTVLGAIQSDTAAVGALEAQWRLSPNVTLGAAWDGIFGNKGQDHAITGRLRIAF